MSLMYKNNLLNSFLFSVNRDLWRSPLCPCGLEEQTSVHLLTNCSMVDATLNAEAKRINALCVYATILEHSENTNFFFFSENTNFYLQH